MVNLSVSLVSGFLAVNNKPSPFRIASWITSVTWVSPILLSSPASLNLRSCARRNDPESC
jgi:hypothetical protein